MPLILNLSSLHTLYPVSKSLDAFTKICNRYSDSNCCPGFFQNKFNLAWVAYQYKFKYKELIEPYKLGKISTQQFLDNLLSIFSFLKENENHNDVSTDDPNSWKDSWAYCLLEEAWNAIIGLEEDKAGRVPRLLELASANPVYLISNTNELNIEKILFLFKRQNPDISFFNNIDLSVNLDRKPVEIAPNIFLCLSYRYQLFKTATQNPYSTGSLIEHLYLNELGDCQSKVKLISQYPADLDEARRLGIQNESIHEANIFFAEQEPLFRKTL